MTKETNLLAPISSGSVKITTVPLYPHEWAIDAQNRAVEYLGCPESQWFVREARRYLALNDRISFLEKELQNLIETESKKG